MFCGIVQLSQAVGDFGAACEALLVKYRKHVIRKFCQVSIHNASLVSTSFSSSDV